MMKAIERESGIQYNVEAIEGGFKVFTESGELYKKLKESTFKKYFKAVKEEQKEAKADKQEEKKAEETPKAEPVSAEKREAMIEKIKKMLALADNNPSEEEALAAALQAHKLMMKYNIHEDDVTLEEVKDDITSVFSEQKHNSQLHTWRKQLGATVAKAFRCKCYISGQDVVFRGYREDAQLALEVYLYLYTVGNRLGSKAYKKQIDETGSGKGAYNSVVLGFLRGVSDAFNEQCTALMVVTPKEVEEEWTQFSAGFKKSSCLIKGAYNRDLYNEGYAEGKNAVKARGIEDKSDWEEA